MEIDLETLEWCVSTFVCPANGHKTLSCTFCALVIYYRSFHAGQQGRGDPLFSRIIWQCIHCTDCEVWGNLVSTLFVGLRQVDCPTKPAVTSFTSSPLNSSVQRVARCTQAGRLLFSPVRPLWDWTVTSRMPDWEFLLEKWTRTGFMECCGVTQSCGILSKELTSPRQCTKLRWKTRKWRKWEGFRRMCLHSQPSASSEKRRPRDRSCRTRWSFLETWDFLRSDWLFCLRFDISPTSELVFGIPQPKRLRAGKTRRSISQRQIGQSVAPLEPAVVERQSQYVRGWNQFWVFAWSQATLAAPTSAVKADYFCRGQMELWLFPVMPDSLFDVCKWTDKMKCVRAISWQLQRVQDKHIFLCENGLDFWGNQSSPGHLLWVDTLWLFTTGSGNFEQAE